MWPTSRWIRLGVYIDTPDKLVFLYTAKWNFFYFIIPKSGFVFQSEIRHSRQRGLNVFYGIYEMFVLRVHLMKLDVNRGVWFFKLIVAKES